MSPRHRLRPLFHVALPVVVASTLVGLAVLNMALVKAGKGDPADGAGLYFSIALVGILAIGVGASVRLRRPDDPATLHFFWLTVSFMGVLSFTPSGWFGHLDRFFEWADVVARLALPPMFLHFAFVFPERHDPWVRKRAGHLLLPLVYLPAFAFWVTRARVMARMLPVTDVAGWIAGLDTAICLYLAACLLAGLGVMTARPHRLRSVTARRQLRWIVWGSAVGRCRSSRSTWCRCSIGRVPRMPSTPPCCWAACPCLRVSLVRYRLMDIEVIIKKVLLVAAVAVVLCWP